MKVTRSIEKDVFKIEANTSEMAKISVAIEMRIEYLKNINYTGCILGELIKMLEQLENYKFISEPTVGKESELGDNNDKILLRKSEELKDLLDDFKKFMNLYERDEENKLFSEHGKNSLDYVIGEFQDIIEILK